MPKTARPYIAFLRAINVGGHTVKMDRLREIFETLGFTSVSTFIASGNVVFEATESRDEALESRIEKALREALGYEVETFIRTPAELARIVAHGAFAGDAGPVHTLSVGFMKAAPGAEAVSRVMALRDDQNDFAVHGRELYWLSRGRTSDSGITPRVLERALGASSTARSMTTLGKLSAKLTTD